MFVNLKSKIVLFQALSILGLLSGLTSCARKNVTTTLSPADQQYKESVVIAQNPSPDKVYDGLVAITRENTNLSWKTVDNQQYVLMATYTSSFSYYTPYIGKPYNTGNYYTWTTASPYLKNLCGDPQWQDGNLALRLNQLLGLPPDDVKEGFVEMWVKPEDLFRPCPDNEITDGTCGLNLPENTQPWYRKWFNDTRAGQYAFCTCDNSQGYPWTQLGYTFDWKDLNSPIGMSEFVVKTNSQVIIKATIPTQDYCSNTP